VADPDEKKRILYQVGAVYERELGDVPRAIDTYQRILELDPDDLQALSRLDVLYEQAQNWPELLSVLTREAEMAGPAEGRVPVPDRRALRETARRRVAGHRALPRHPPSAGADHEPTLAALEAAQGRLTRIRSVPPPCSSPCTRPGATGARSSAVHEVQVAHGTDPFQKVGPPAPDRAPLRGRARRARRTRSTRTRARSRSTTATSRRSRTSSASPWRSASGADVAASTTPSSTSSTRSRRGSWSSVSGPRRSTRCSSRT
jgi:hypothetical protein